MEQLTTYHNAHQFIQYVAEACSSAENEKILNSLQHDYGINPNIFLFCCWTAQTGRGKLSKKQLQQAISDTYAWHEQIVLSLRQVGQTIPLKAEKTLKRLRESIENEAHTALAIEQLMIAESVPELIGKTMHLARQLSHALKSLSAYSNALQIHFDTQDCIKISKLLTALFPKLDQPTVLTQCKKNLLNKKIPSNFPVKQARIPLQ